VITAYIPPDNTRLTHSVIYYLYWIIHNILSKNYQAPIILSGDFNFHVKKITKYLQNLDLKGVFDDNTPTHKAGDLLN
jgi:hypothetical protein